MQIGIGMADNLLQGILNIATYGEYNLKKYASIHPNRVNAVGEQLELYMKDALASAFNSKKRLDLHENVFAWLGNQNHYPDLILQGGDAFDIKKIESTRSALALNSSPPKDKLLASDIRITTECKECDGGKWKEKDLFYVIGNVKSNILKSLFIVQGTCYAANHAIYEKEYTPLKKEIASVIDSLEFEKADTVELGKVRRVDPLGITELRIRGMWSIENPLEVFSELCNISSEKFHLFVLLRNDKYSSYPVKERSELEKEKNFVFTKIKIKNPNNPAELVEAKLITFIAK